MGQIMPFSVTVFEDGQSHHLGDFRRLDPARSAARLALHGRGVTLAVVKDRTGCMVYACDQTREWDEEGGVPMA